MPTMCCPYCGRANRSGATFCAGCGQRLAPWVGAPTLLTQVNLKRYARRLGLALGRLWEQARQEAIGWYYDLAARQPAVTGEIVSTPAATTIAQTKRFYALIVPSAVRSAQLPALNFQIRPLTGGDQAVLMVGLRQGDPLCAGDKVRAWGVWDRDLTALRAWRLEAYERGGQPANYVVTTSRPWPLAVISTAFLGFLLLSCLCSLLTR